MSVILEIRDHDSENNLAVGLRELLDIVSDIGHNLSWAILDIEAIGDLGEGLNMLDLENKVCEASNGLSLSWEELVALAENVSDIIDIVIVGYDADSQCIPRLSPEHPIDLLYSTCDIVLELVDSSLWVIYLSDDNVADRIKSIYHDVVVL